MTKDNSEEKSSWLGGLKYFKSSPHYVYPPNALFSGPSRSKEAQLATLLAAVVGVSWIFYKSSNFSFLCVFCHILAKHVHWSFICLYFNRDNKSTTHYEGNRLPVPKLSSDLNGLYICNASNQYGGSLGSLYVRVHNGEFIFVFIVCVWNSYAMENVCGSCWNLLLIAKIMEKLVSFHAEINLAENNTFESFQSGFHLLLQHWDGFYCAW